MTLKVPKSQVEGIDFAAAVEEHVAALRAHEEHMAKVRAEEGKKPEEREYEAYPAPTAHPLVDGAVRRVEGGGFAADYVVEDDGPTAEERFARKRNDLLSAVTSAETKARAAVIAPGKVRLHAIKVADLAAKARERDRVKLLRRENPGDAVADAPQMTADDQRFAAEAEAIEKRLDAINRHGAMMHAEIDDLTAETVDGWTMKEFPR